MQKEISLEHFHSFGRDWGRSRITNSHRPQEDLRPIGTPC